MVDKFNFDNLRGGRVDSVIVQTESDAKSSVLDTGGGGA